MKLTVLIFRTKFAPKVDFQSKTARRVNITTEFYILELAHSPGQGICNRIEKSSETGQGKKSLISDIYFNFWVAGSALGYVATQIWDFCNIS